MNSLSNVKAYIFNIEDGSTLFSNNALFRKKDIHTRIYFPSMNAVINLNGELCNTELNFFQNNLSQCRVLSLCRKITLSTEVFNKIEKIINLQKTLAENLKSFIPNFRNEVDAELIKDNEDILIISGEIHEKGEDGKLQKISKIFIPRLNSILNEDESYSFEDYSKTTKKLSSYKMSFITNEQYKAIMKKIN